MMVNILQNGADFLCRSGVSNLNIKRTGKGREEGGVR